MRDPGAELCRLRREKIALRDKLRRRVRRLQAAAEEISALRAETRVIDYELALLRRAKRAPSAG